MIKKNLNTGLLIKENIFITIFSTLMLITIFVQAQTSSWQWATRAGGSDWDLGRSIYLDSAGNSYVTGNFRNTATFGSYSLTSSGYSDIFVAKMNANGNWLWATQAGGFDYDGGYGITIDDVGNSYVTGNFRNTATFGSYSLTSSGNNDIFVAKMDAGGNWLWATRAGGIDSDEGCSIALDSAGNSYVTGYFKGTATFGSTSLTSSGILDIFVAKMDVNGNWQWATRAGGSDWDLGRSIDLDSAGNSYVTGFFKGTATFGSTSLTSSGISDIFVAKMDVNGNWQWATRAGGSDYDNGNSITLDSAGNSYVTGYFEGTATFVSTSLTSSGCGDIFVAKMDVNGNWQWAEKAGGTSGDYGFSIALDSAGNSYVTGFFEGTATFGSTSLTSSGYYDIFVAKMDAYCNWQWAEKAGGSYNDVGYSIALDSAGNSYVTGRFEGTATFGSISLTSSGYPDIFVAKLGEDNPEIILLTPTTDETITTPEILFSWTDAGADHYELIVDNNEGFGSPEVAERHTVFNEIFGTSYELCGNWLSENYYYWKVKGFFTNGDSIVSSIGTFTYAPTKLDEPDWAPIYRAYHPTDIDHFYCTADSHLAQANSNGYNYEKTEGYLSIYPFETPDLVNIFRLYKSENGIPSENRHYYTTDESDKDNKIIEGWDYEGITGYAFGTSHTELVKMYYVFLNYGNPVVNDNFYTTSEIERNNAIGSGYIDGGFLAYVSLNGNLAMRPWNERQPSAGYGINPQNGNFNHYTKSSFSIPGGRMSLDFAHTYNSYSARLMCPINPLGPGWSHTYSAYIFESDELIYVFWPGGTIHIYDSSTLQPLTLGVYDELTKISDTYEIKKKNQVVYTFEILNPGDETAFLTSITDRNENTITCSYIPETERRLTSVTGPKGRILTFTYYTESCMEHLIHQVTDPIGRNIQFDYDDDLNLIQFTDATGNSTIYSYDLEHREEHLLTQIQLPEGNVITNSYDNKKIISQNIGSTGQSLQVLYNEPTITQIIDENGITQDYEYTSEIDGLIQHILTTGSNFTYYYGDTSNPTKPTIITDGNNNDTMVDYDVMGNAVIIEKPYNIIHQFEYNAFNDVTLYTDPRGKQYQYGYDDNGNLTSIDKPDPFSSITLSYNIDGTINQITDPLSQATTFDYNQYGNVTNITDNLSHTTTYDYDDVSRLTSMTNANNQTTSYTYFNNDLLQGVTDANDNTTTYTYDDNDNLETVTNAENQTTTLTYNNKDLIESISNPLSQQTSYTYFDNGKLQTKTKPDGQTINYSYDDKGRLSNISGGTINGIISYDNNNNIVHINDNNGDIWFNDYDGLNRLEYYTDYYENEVHYNYDESSNITSIIYQDNKTVTYTYYDNNQLETVTDWNGNTTTYTYRADGTLQGIQYPNGINCSFEYDLASRLIGLRNSIGQDTINSYSYTLDDIGNHTSVDLTEPFSNPIISELNESYEYNDANQILSAGSVTFNHDENGNMTQRSGNTTTNYTWDILNRLTNVDVNNTSYVYDLFGNRCAVTENDVTTRYVLDINGPMSIVIMETDENGNVINYYIYGLGLISRIDANNNTNYYHYDSIGSTIAMTDENGIITHKYAYGPFGQVLQHEEEDDNSFRYVGKYGVMYEDNGLYFMRARYYNPQIGRFISEDPIWDFNLYAYGGNNPIIKIDPLGLTDQSLVIKKDEFNSEISAPKDPTVDDLTYWMLVELHETDVLFKYGNEVKLQETQVPSCNIFIAWEVYYGIPMAQAIAEEQVKTEAYEIFEKGGIESSKQEIHRIRLEYDESYRKAQGIYTFDEKISLWIYRNIWLPFKNSFK